MFAEKARKKNLNMYDVAESDIQCKTLLTQINPGNPCSNSYSVAKIFTVTAVGLLFDKGLLLPKQTLEELLPNEICDAADYRVKDITLHQLMTHTAGFGINLDIDCWDPTEFGKDYLKKILSYPLKWTPGGGYEYTDSAFYIVSRIVEKVAGVTTLEFLRPVLMGIMDFKELAWSCCPMGHTMGATGLYIRTDDMVKLGVLYLRKGDWFGTRVLSECWCETVLKEGYELHLHPSGWYEKGGMWGQLLAINLEEGKALACHAYDGNNMTDEMLL